MFLLDKFLINVCDLFGELNWRFIWGWVKNCFIFFFGGVYFGLLGFVFLGIVCGLGFLSYRVSIVVILGEGLWNECSVFEGV